MGRGRGEGEGSAIAGSGRGDYEGLATHRKTRRRRSVALGGVASRAGLPMARVPRVFSKQARARCYCALDTCSVEAIMLAPAPLLSRITARREIFGGKPIVRDMRISVELVLSLLAQGQTADQILDDYPDLELEDIRACLAYAHASIANGPLNGPAALKV